MVFFLESIRFSGHERHVINPGSSCLAFCFRAGGVHLEGPSRGNHHPPRGETTTHPELGICADDLTGATDTGLQFAKAGRRTSVCLSWPASPSCDVLVFDADSRHRSPAVARQRALAATEALKATGAERFYKKVDSTGRGNLGAEIEGMLDALSVDLALICPAFPRLGRTVKDGRILVRGVPLDQSEFARDPLWPATTPSLATILRRQSTLPIEPLPLDEVRGGPARVRARLRVQAAGGRGLAIADAETDGDLRCLAEAMRDPDLAILPVGSAGLAEALADGLSREAREPGRVTIAPGPILMVAGTLNRIGIAQIARVLARGAAFVPVPLERALDEPDRVASELAARIGRDLREASCVVVTLADPQAPRLDLPAVMRDRGLDPAVASERLTRVMGRAADGAMRVVAPSALVLTGGDTARGACGALGSFALDVRREIAPGVPLNQLQGGRWDGLPVVTKAGGFGDLETLARVVHELEGMRA